MGLFRRKAAQPVRNAGAGRAAELEQLAGELEQQIERALPQMLADIEREADLLLPEIERDAARLLTTHDAETRDLYVTNTEERPENEQAVTATREGYMSPEVEAHALALLADGLPNARLEKLRDRLVVTTPSGLVNPRSRTAHRAGLYSFSVRGTAHYRKPPQDQLALGRPIRLVREPRNKHDPNAICVFVDMGQGRVGYVPRGLAKRLAPLLDAGVDLVAISVLDVRDGATPHILVCDRRLHEHLNRRDWC